MHIISQNSILGVLTAIFLAYLASEIMRYIIRRYEEFTAPPNIEQTKWENVFNPPEGVLKINNIIGYAEVTFYFLVFFIGIPGTPTIIKILSTKDSRRRDKILNYLLI